MERQWFVYILTNYQNAVLYTGITNNLQRRVMEHHFQDLYTVAYGDLDSSLRSE